MGCEHRDELTINYLLALEQVREARREKEWSVNRIQRECAAMRLKRLEAERLDRFRELTEHCFEHSCANQDIDEILTDAASYCHAEAR